MISLKSITITIKTQPLCRWFADFFISFARNLISRCQAYETMKQVESQILIRFVHVVALIDRLFARKILLGTRERIRRHNFSLFIYFTHLLYTSHDIGEFVWTMFYFQLVVVIKSNLILIYLMQKKDGMNFHYFDYWKLRTRQFLSESNRNDLWPQMLGTSRKRS